MSFPAYPDYKESGVPWLGSIPKHWTIGRIKDLFEIRKRIAGELGHDVLSITQSGLRVKDVESNDGQQAMDYSKYQLVHPGDFAMNHMDLLTGWIDIASQSGVTSPDYRVFALRDPSVTNDRFYLSVFQMAYSARQFYPFGQGSSQLGRWRLPTDAFNAFPIPVPPKAEQDTIRAFLDRETAKIDALVDVQLRMIALVREKQQVVISQAVTKGLNSDAPKMDSGVEWLGEIPANWEIVNLARIAPLIQTGPFGSQLHAEDYVEDQFPVINPSNLRNGHIVANPKNTITEKKAISLERHRLSAGEIVLARRGEMGRCAVVAEDQAGWICGTGCLRISLNSAALARFIATFLATQFVVEKLKLNSVGATMDNLNASIVSKILVPLPPIVEQQQIVKSIGAIASHFDVLIESARSAITLLQERRAALVSAAVTGKIDVRALSHNNNVVSIASSHANKALPPLRSIVGVYAVVHFGKLGRMAVMKAGFLAEAHAGLHELSGRYERNAAGPYDGSLIAAMERGAAELCGISACEPQQEGQRVTYTVPSNLVLPCAKLTEAAGPERARAFENLLALLKGISREGVEAIATIYSVWNDLLADAKPANDDAISTGVLTKWHSEKAVKFKRVDIDHWLAWMRRNSMVPDGTAPRTDHQGSLFA